MEYDNVDDCSKQLTDLTEELKALEILNKEYVTKLEEVGELQEKCAKQLNHHQYGLKIVKNSLNKIRKKCNEKQTIDNLLADVDKQLLQLDDVEQTLPKKNGLYLRIILGTINVSILNKNDRFRYKDEYEKFKLILSVIGFFMALMNLIFDVRIMQIMLIFLLVWYYCTLTIRESILKVNGSRIKGWWRLHHFISTVVSGVFLIWPNNTPWYLFRQKFMIFNVYISVVQYMQFVYQQGVLYRLKALGERHNMDITIEGFHSWMWRGLSFLLPFLYFGYIFQLYNGYVLYKLSFHPEATWQVFVCSILFFVLFLGNTITTSMVIPQKLQERYSAHYKVDLSNNGSAKKLN